MVGIFWTLATTSTSTGSGGVTGNTDASDKIALANRGQDNTGAINHNKDYRVCFTDEGPTICDGDDAKNRFIE